MSCSAGRIEGTAPSTGLGTPGNGGGGETSTAFCAVALNTPRKPTGWPVVALTRLRHDSRPSSTSSVLPVTSMAHSPAVDAATRFAEGTEKVAATRGPVRTTPVPLEPRDNIAELRHPWSHHVATPASATHPENPLIETSDDAPPDMSSRSSLAEAPALGAISAAVSSHAARTPDALLMSEAYRQMRNFGTWKRPRS